jgi:hypothetical protein
MATRRTSQGCSWPAVLCLLLMRTTAAAQLQYDGTDHHVNSPGAQATEGVIGVHQRMQYDGFHQGMFPGIHLTESVTEMLQVVLSGIGTGSFTITRLTELNVTRIGELLVRTYGDFQFLMLIKGTRCTRESEDRRWNNRDQVMTDGGGPSKTLATTPTAQFEAVRTKSSISQSQAAPPWPMLLRLRAHG